MNKQEAVWLTANIIFSDISWNDISNLEPQTGSGKKYLFYGSEMRRPRSF